MDITNTAAPTPKATRELNGQYATTKWELLCKCGRTLGQHMAAAPRDADSGDEPYCPGFKKATKFSPVA